jgi:hypothetical protein
MNIDKLPEVKKNLVMKGQNLTKKLLVMLCAAIILFSSVYYVADLYVTKKKTLKSQDESCAMVLQNEHNVRQLSLSSSQTDNQLQQQNTSVVNEKKEGENIQNCETSCKNSQIKEIKLAYEIRNNILLGRDIAEQLLDLSGLISNKKQLKEVATLFSISSQRLLSISDIRKQFLVVEKSLFEEEKCNAITNNKYFGMGCKILYSMVYIRNYAANLHRSPFDSKLLELRNELFSDDFFYALPINTSDKYLEEFQKNSDNPINIKNKLFKKWFEDLIKLNKALATINFLINDLTDICELNKGEK